MNNWFVFYKNALHGTLNSSAMRFANAGEILVLPFSISEIMAGELSSLAANSLLVIFSITFRPCNIISGVTVEKYFS